MKVCKFLITVSKQGSESSIVDSVTECYLYKQTKDTYIQFCKNEFEKLGNNIPKFFGKEGVVAWRNVDGFDYYILKHKEGVDSSQKLCFEILLIIESTQLIKAVAGAFEDIEQTLKKNTMNVSFSEDYVYVYLVKNRFLPEEIYYVKAFFKKKKETLQERCHEDLNKKVSIAVVILCLVSFIVHLLIPYDLLWLVTTFVGMLISTCFTNRLEIKKLKSMREDSIIVNDFDQEWFSQDTAAESTVSDVAKPKLFVKPADAEAKGGEQ